MRLTLNEKGKQFTKGWFRTRNMATFAELVYPKWSGRDILYLEIGVFEGMSLLWMMQHVLTSGGSRAVGIDPWLMTMKQSNEYMEQAWNRTRHNLQEWTGTGVLGRSLGHRCNLIRGFSGVVLRKMIGRGGFMGVSCGTVDLCMVDGAHESLFVLDDALQCYHLLKPGGWMMFDDVVNARKKGDDHVRLGIDMFLERMPGAMKLEWKHKHMECYVKL